MSEYQFVAFRAVDRPVSDKNLDYMEKQSSRAEITPWSFDNQYNYGDFGGNAAEMLRRGYDIHLHYANYGVRKLMIRLPHGLPDPAAAKPYLSKDGVQIIEDKEGPGCILSLQPYYEPDTLDELWDVDELIDELVPLRSELIDGDLRPLYLAHLAISCDAEHAPEETVEAPVPAGLDNLTPAQKSLCTYFGLSDALIEAAAAGAPAMDARHDPRGQLADWLRACPAATKDAWLLDWMSDPQSSLRAEVLAEFRKERPAQLWPTARLDRTVAALEEAAAVIAREAKARADAVARQAQARAAAKAARERQTRMAAMKSDPQPTLRRTEELVNERGRTSYNEAATLLAELREALRETPHARLADEQAAELRKKHPTLKMLVSALRKENFLPQ